MATYLHSLLTLPVFQELTAWLSTLCTQPVGNVGSCPTVRTAEVGAHLASGVPALSGLFADLIS